MHMKNITDKFKHKTAAAVTILLCIIGLLLIATAGIFSPTYQTNQGISVSDPAQPIPGIKATILPYNISVSPSGGGEFGKFEVMVTADVESANTASVAEVVIEFDPAQVNGQSIVTRNSLLYLNKNIDNNSGTITFDVSTQNRAFDQGELLAVVSFELLTKASDNISVQISPETRLGVESDGQQADKAFYYENRLQVNSSVGAIKSLSEQSAEISLGNAACNYFFTNWTSCNDYGFQSRSTLDFSTCSTDELEQIAPQLLVRSCKENKPEAILKINGAEATTDTESPTTVSVAEGKNDFLIEIADLQNIDYCTLATTKSGETSYQFIYDELSLPIAIPESDPAIKISYQLSCQNNQGSVIKTIDVLFAEKSPEVEIELSKSNIVEEKGRTVSYDVNWSMAGDLENLTSCRLVSYEPIAITLDSPTTNPVVGLQSIENGKEPLSVIMNPEVPGEIEIPIAVGGSQTFKVLSANASAYIDHGIICQADNGADISSDLKRVSVYADESVSVDLSVEVPTEDNLNTYPSLFKLSANWSVKNFDSCSIAAEPFLVQTTSQGHSIAIEAVGGEPTIESERGTQEFKVTGVDGGIILGDWKVRVSVTCTGSNVVGIYTQYDFEDVYISASELKGNNPEVCASVYDPFCGSDGKTYGDICAFNEAKELNPELEFAYDGECESTATSSSVSSNTSSASSSRSPETTSSSTSSVASSASTSTSSKSISSQSSTSTQTSSTSSDSGVCATGGTAEDQVCGKIGDEYKLYTNECSLEQANAEAVPMSLCLSSTSSSASSSVSSEVSSSTTSASSSLGNGTACASVYDPVCGVDGVTYSNACFATTAGVIIAEYNACGESTSPPVCDDNATNFDVRCDIACTPQPNCVYGDNDEETCNPPYDVNWCPRIDAGEATAACKFDRNTVHDGDTSAQLDITDFAEFAKNYKKELEASSCTQLDLIDGNCILDLNDFRVFGKYYRVPDICSEG